MRWHSDRNAWKLVVLGYLPFLAASNLVWETAQLPLYAIWSDAPIGEIAFAVAHCTAGDVVIGATALIAALIVTRSGPLEGWRWLRLGFIATTAGLAYTGFSEWANTAVKSSWQYSALMPTLDLGGIRLGLAPLAQWLLLPPLALYLARRTRGAPCPV
jgi:hypothetical protein